MKKLLVISLCMVLVAMSASAEKYGPIPNYRGTKQQSAYVEIPTAGPWYVYNPLTGEYRKFGAYGGGRYDFNYTVPVFVNSYIEVDPCYPSMSSMRLIEAVTYDEHPDEPYIIPDVRGFTNADPEVMPVLTNPGDFWFAGKYGAHYVATVVTMEVAQLQTPTSPLYGFDTSNIKGPPENLVHVIQVTIPPNQVEDFIGQFEFKVNYLGTVDSGDPCMPYAHDFELEITEWDPSVSYVTDLDWQAPYITPGYVEIVTPSDWSIPGRTFGRIGYERNPGQEIVVGGGTYGWTVKAKNPYVYPGHAYLTKDGQMCSPAIQTMIVAPDPNNDCGTSGYLRADLNADCDVGFVDFALFAGEWLKCTNPGVTGCVQETIAGLGIVYNDDDTESPAKVLDLYHTHAPEVETGDIIVEYCGIPISSGASLRAAAQTLPPPAPGQPIGLTVLRSGSSLKLTAVAVSMPTFDPSATFYNRYCTKIAISTGAFGLSTCACEGGSNICTCKYEYGWYGTWRFHSFRVRKVCSDNAGNNCVGSWLGLM